MSGETVRGDCSACGRSVQLKADGTVRHHGGPERRQWPYGREYRCDGSGQKPKATSTKGER